MNTSSSSSDLRSSGQKRTASPQTEFAWLALVIAAVIGAVLGHYVWRRPLSVAAFAGTLGYLAGALVDRARRQ